MIEYRNLLSHTALTWWTCPPASLALSKYLEASEPTFKLLENKKKLLIEKCSSLGKFSNYLVGFVGGNWRTKAACLNGLNDGVYKSLQTQMTGRETILCPFFFFFFWLFSLFPS